MAKTHSEAGMGFTAPSIGLIVCLFLVSTDAQGIQNNSTNGTDASVCTSGKGRNRIKCDEIVTQAPVFRADLYQPCGDNCSAAPLPDAAAFFVVRSTDTIQYRVLLGLNWTVGWNESNLMALYDLANTTSAGDARLVAALCGPGDLPKCGAGAPGKLLLEGNLTQEGLAKDSPLDMAGLRQMMRGYFKSTSSTNYSVSVAATDAPDMVERAPAIQVLAQGPAADGQPSQTILAGPLYPTNAAALSRAAVPQAAGARLDGGTPYHAFMWPVPDTNSTAAGSISATLYNDSSFAYSIVVRRIATNDSITSCAMEAVSLKVLNSTAVFPNGAFAYTQRGCCGGQAPNFFTSYPTGLQPPPGGEQFLLTSAEWAPPTESSSREIYVGRLLATMQTIDYAVSIRLRTKNFPDGLLLGEFRLGCGPDNLGLPASAACQPTTSGARRRRRARR